MNSSIHPKKQPAKLSSKQSTQPESQVSAPRPTRQELKKALKDKFNAKRNQDATLGVAAKADSKDAKKSSKSAKSKASAESVELSDSKASSLTKFPKSLIPKILIEDKHYLIINKPAGLVVHPDGKTIEPTLCDWIVKEYPKLVGVGEPSKAPDGTLLDRPGIVHRLDRETSGVLVIAKTQESFEFLKKSFQTRDVQKTYNTFVWGLVKEDEGSIDRPIGRSKTDFRKWSAERFARGDLRPATTEYRVLERRTFAEGEKNVTLVSKTAAGAAITASVSKSSKIPLNFTFVEAFPKTGRTHQIRVHFKAINHPVVGDALYAPNHPYALGFERLALHSRSISFTSINGKRVEVEAPLPDDFKEAIKLLK